MTNPKNTINSKPSESEEQLQAKCYQWFHNQFPALRGLLFHIPNGGNRSQREGAKFKAIGVVPGIPDLILAPAKALSGYSPILFIEMKALGGKLSNNQENMRQILTQNGSNWTMCNNFEYFKKIIIEHLRQHRVDPCSNVQYDENSHYID